MVSVFGEQEGSGGYSAVVSVFGEQAHAQSGTVSADSVYIPLAAMLFSDVFCGSESPSPRAVGGRRVCCILFEYRSLLSR